MNDIEVLTESVDHFCQLISSLPYDSLAEQEWGPKEVLAHLVFHHEHYVRLVEAQVERREAPLPVGRFSDLNAYAVDASREITTATLIYRLHKANHRLLALYQQYDPCTIHLQIKARAKLRTLASLVPEVEAHIRNHAEKLRKQIKPRRKEKEMVA